MFNWLTAAVFAVLGLTVGFLSLRIAKSKSKPELKNASVRRRFQSLLLDRKWIPYFWVISFIALYILALLMCNNIVALIYTVLFIFCAFNIAAVDLAIRRIPNELLLILLIISLVRDIVEPIVNKDTSEIKYNLIYAAIGIVGGFVLFILPSFLHIYIGNGDIKLSAVIGFSLGIIGYIQAIVHYGGNNACISGCSLITKKGGLKKKRQWVLLWHSGSSYFALPRFTRSGTHQVIPAFADYILISDII
jgi:prepilin signal peptidase PulO-like enzyme (type II secretory pathway)